MVTSAGAPVKLSNDLKEQETLRFKEHEFNVMVSEALHLNRSLPDVRTKE